MSIDKTNVSVTAVVQTNALINMLAKQGSPSTRAFGLMGSSKKLSQNSESLTQAREVVAKIVANIRNMKDV
jgi:hypothetical protein|tara:strand:+ start:681 stop:893 length:213 start_codon:yes stop_codon:yes gene_type:complete